VWTRELPGDFSVSSPWTDVQSAVLCGRALLWRGSLVCVCRARGVGRNPLITCLRGGLAVIITLLNIGSGCGQVADNVGSLGSLLPLTVLLLLAAASYWRFVRQRTSQPQPGSPLDPQECRLLVSVFFAFTGIEAGSAWATRSESAPRDSMAILVGAASWHRLYRRHAALLVALPSSSKWADGFVNAFTGSRHLGLGWLLAPSLCSSPQRHCGAAANLSSTRSAFVAGIHHYLPPRSLDSPPLSHALGCHRRLRIGRHGRGAAGQAEPPSAGL